MADDAPPRPDIREQNKVVIAEYRATGGKTADGGMPLVLLTTTGNKSGNEHTTPVCVREDTDGVLVVAGSKGGMKDHPQWYKNLQAKPELTVEYLGETYQATAVVQPNTTDRDRLFGMMSEVIHSLYQYQDKCRNHRQIPVMRLERI